MNDKVAIYVRLSREDEDKIDNNKESKSIDNQINVLKNFAKEQGFVVYQIYSDDGFSGADFNRPAFMQMLFDMKQKKFDVLLLKDLSRLGRSLHKVGDFIENVFPANGIRVISVNDKYDSSLYNDDMSIVLRSFLNDYYLKEFRKKCKKSREFYAQTKHLNYYPKYGYRFNEEGQEIIDEYSANVVKRIFSLIANNSVSCGSVAKILNAEGILTRSAYASQVLKLKALHKKPADKWNADKVWSIATDYEYCGHSINLANHKKNQRILLKNTHCLIVSEELYYKAQKQIKSHSKVKRKLEHLGCIIVDEKSRKNLLFSKKQQVYFLRENNRKIYSISKNIIDTVLFLDCIAVIEEMVEKYIALRKEKCVQNKTRLLEEFNIKYSSLIDLRFQNKIDEQTYIKKCNFLSEKIESIEKESIKNTELEKIKDLIVKLRQMKDKKMQVIRKVIKTCYIIKSDADNIYIKLRYS